MTRTLIFSVLGSLVAATLSWMLWTYRSLRQACHEREKAWHRLDTTLHQRHELIPPILKAASGYLVMENTALESVAVARSYAMQARSVLARTKTETDLSWALARLMVAAEHYPGLHTHPDFADAERRLTDAENQIAAARNGYNRQVDRLEFRLRHLPHWLTARLFRIHANPSFDLDPVVARHAMMGMLAPQPGNARRLPQLPGFIEPLLHKVG